MADQAQERLAIALQNQEFSSIASILDEAELQSTNPNVLQDWPHALHLLGHIYNSNLEDARFLWKRLPNDVKQVQPVIEALMVKTRQDMVNLLSQAYSTIALGHVASLLGNTEADALAMAQAMGWTLDASSNMLMVCEIPAPDSQRDGYANMQQLTEYMVHLEN